MKEPYWIINKKLIKVWRKSDWSLFKMIHIWLLTQLFYFYELNIKSCKKEHFWGIRMTCLRCKRAMADIGHEKRRKMLNARK